MTTNAIDRRSRVIASDSRWSIELQGQLYFVDNTGFDKIADRAMGSIICAGDAKLIEIWRDWFHTPVLNMAATPAFERKGPDGKDYSIVISLVYKTGDYNILSQGWYLLHGDDAKFCGSGAEHALACYASNKCGRTSVVSAASKDPMTGGETKFVELETSRNNLSTNRVSLADATHQLQTKGNVMDMKSGKITPIAPQAAGSLDEALRAGNVSLSAPTGQPTRLWTDPEKENLLAALARLNEMEEAANR